MANIDFGSGSDTPSGDFVSQALVKLQSRVATLENGGVDPTPSNPVFSVQPFVDTDGTPQTGETLYGHAGTYANGTISGIQWLKSGLPINGATSLNYTPTETGVYRLKVTIQNSAGVTADGYSPSISVTASPSNAPQAVGTLPHKYYNVGSGGGSVQITTAEGFSGSGITYSIEAKPQGAIVSINSTTGVITASTAEALPENAGYRALRVRATNSSGYAEQEFPFFIVVETTSLTLGRQVNGKLNVISVDTVKPLRTSRLSNGNIYVQEPL